MWQGRRESSPSVGCFNPHTYMRCDFLAIERIIKIRLFQSTHLHEVWLVGFFPVLLNSTFQSTHLHEVWLSFLCMSMHATNVSIHTPTWGVTPVRSHPVLRSWVSIHTPTWGVTSWGEEVNGEWKVSIHTPTWGVTLRNSSSLVDPKFQSTHLHEVWLILS